MQLYAYQTDLLHRLESSLYFGRKPLATLATGGGKTHIFVQLAQNWSGNVIIAVHRDFLVSQTAKKIYESGGGVPTIIADKAVQNAVHNDALADGHLNGINGKIIVGMIGRLRNLSKKGRLDDFIDADTLILFDEAHHCAANTWLDFIQFVTERGAKICGFTATPERADGAGLGGTFDHLENGLQVADLQNIGRLTPAIVYAPPADADLSAFKIRMGEFKALDQSKVFGDPVREWNARAKGCATIAYTHSIAAADNLNDMFCRAEIKSKVLHSKLTKTEQETALNELRQRKIDILVSVDMIGEGLDVPLVECVLMQRKTLSLSLYLQMVGRGLRQAEGKEKLIVIDMVGNTLMHGFIDSPRKWSLHQAKRNGKKALRESPKPYVECGNCGVIINRLDTTCPHCGIERLREAEAAVPEYQKEVILECITSNRDLLAGHMQKYAEMVKQKRVAEKGAAYKQVESFLTEFFEQGGTLKMARDFAEAVGYKAGTAYYIWQAYKEKKEQAYASETH